MSEGGRDVEEIVSAVERHAHDLPLLLTGFDGVLAEYNGNPNRVRLSAARRALLRAFSQRSDAALGVVSGRRVRDLKARMMLGRKVFYVGLHGLEIEGPHFVRHEREAFESNQERMHDIASTLEPAVASVAGVRVEDKGAAIAVHTREAGASDAVWARIRLLNAAADLVNSQEVRLVRGNHVLELLPNVTNSRAAAIRAIREHLEQRHQRSVFTVYIGEDVVDDDAVRAVEGAGIVAVVGRRASRAHYHLASPAVVERLIASLTGALSHPALHGSERQRSG